MLLKWDLTSEGGLVGWTVYCNSVQQFNLTQFKCDAKKQSKFTFSYFCLNSKESKLEYMIFGSNTMLI